MMKSLVFLNAALLGMLGFAACSQAEAQQYVPANSSNPLYSRSGFAQSQSQSAQLQFVCRSGCGLPIPGTPLYEPPNSAHFYALGVQALQKHEYEYATDMFKVAASWASKPAEYSLGLMYFRGDGVPTDRSLGAAWMTLAAERGDPQYVKARDAMVGLLTESEVAQANALPGEVSGIYAHKVALRRAKAQRRWDGTYGMTWTGSRWVRNGYPGS